MKKHKICKLCGNETNSGFNINFELIPICEKCAITIFLQQANWYAKQKSKNLKILGKKNESHS